MTEAQAKHLARIYKLRLDRKPRTAMYRVSLQEWPALDWVLDERAYFTTDLADAVRNGQMMRIVQGALERNA